MRSAQRRKRNERREIKSRFFGLFFKIAAPVLIILGVVIFLKLSIRFWNGQDKFAVAYMLGSGDVAVTVLDPKLNDATTLVIPGDTQVDVARNYGTMKIKNVWQLGINEKIGGRLLPETITQNFLFPVFLWGGVDAEVLGSGNISNILHFALIPESTNISFGDRLLASLFSLKLQEIGRDRIDLGKSQFLTKKKLNDGTAGYILQGTPSPRLTAYFSDNLIAAQNLRVGIVDATGEAGVAEKVGQIVEVMGGKIVAVDKKTPADTDCTIFGKDAKAVKKVANIFGCKIEKGTGDFDLTITLGQKFAKRF